MHSNHILISAYAVNPFKGSEDGTGWNISREIAKDHNVTVITRKNNIPHIERYLSQQGGGQYENMRFIGFDLPNWVLWLKKKSGERGYVAYYYLWQLFLPLFIFRQKLDFDLAHAVNFHSDSVPTFLWVLGKPTVWGPVGHHPKVEREFLEHYGRSSFVKDRLYYAVKWALRNLDPFFRLAVKRVDKILVINSSVAAAMGAPASKVEIIPAVAAEMPSMSVKQAATGFKVLSVGRFHYMKGFDVSIRAFAHFLHDMDETSKAMSELILVGKGEEKGRLMDMADVLDIKDHIRWVDWVDRDEMQALYQEASVFLFPSHEGAGMVVPEAMSYGLPVVCLDNVGPGELAGEAGVKVMQTSYNQTIRAVAKALFKLFHDKNFVTLKSRQSLSRFVSAFTWRAKGEKIKAVYNTIGGSDVKPTRPMAIFHPSSELYGADRILVNAINAMPDDQPKVVYLKSSGPLVEYIQQHTTNAEVRLLPFLPVIYRGIFNPAGLVRLGGDCFRFWRFLCSAHRQHRFGSAYVNTLSNVLVIPFLKYLHIKTFVHVHEIIDSPKFIGWFTAQLSARFASNIVCVSEAVKAGLERYSEHITSKITVIHNGIDRVDVQPKPLNGTLKFYLFGRIMEKKGQWYLIEALKRLPKAQLTNVQFTLMGGAVPGQEHMMEQLESDIRAAALDEVVQIKSFAPNISEAMADADVCLVPSLMKDPFPTTVLEAMSAGRPVIATNHGGAKEALETPYGSDCGLLIDPDEPAQLAASISQLIQQRERIPVMGENARERYASAFTKQHFEEKWGAFLVEGHL